MSSNSNNTYKSNLFFSSSVNKSAKKLPIPTYFHLYKLKRPKDKIKINDNDENKENTTKKYKVLNTTQNPYLPLIPKLPTSNNNKAILTENNISNSPNIKIPKLQLKNSNSVILPKLPTSINTEKSINSILTTRTISNNTNNNIHLHPNINSSKINIPKPKLPLNPLDNAITFQDKSFLENAPQFTIYHLNNISIQLDIEILFTNIINSEVSYTSIISYDKESKLIHYLFTYYDNFRSYLKTIHKARKPNLFMFPQLNNIHLKILKVQLLTFSCLFITLAQYSIIKASLIIKSHFVKLIKQLTFSLLNIYHYFNDKSQFQSKSKEMNYDYESFNKLFYDVYYKYYNTNNISVKVTSFSEMFISIEKTVNKCIQMLKYYSQIQLTNSSITSLENIINQLILQSSMNSNFNFYARIIFDTLLYNIFSPFQNDKVVNNNILNKNVPYLPELNTKLYKYTLILDMDETLIHYCLFEDKAMYFVRPFCFEFLSKLKKYYELIVFTSATKDVSCIFLYNISL